MSRANRAIGKITGADPGRTYQIPAKQIEGRRIEPLPIGESPDERLRTARLVDTPSGATSKPHGPPDGAFWNAIARAWFVDVGGETVRLDPQPSAPSVAAHNIPVSPRIDL